MKLRFFLLFSLFLSSVNGRGEQVPQVVGIELNAVKVYTEKACTFDGEVLEPEVGGRYWAAMRRLGNLVIENGEGDWLPLLTPLERRIVRLAEDHARHPELARTLSQWYGRHPGEVSAEVRGIKDKDTYDRMVAQFAMRRGFEVERLHEEHATREYLLAWEAWFLAPKTMEKAYMIHSVGPVLSKNATDQLLPTLSYMARLSVKGESGRGKRLNWEMGVVLGILRGLKTEASVVAALEVFALARQHQIAPAGIAGTSEVLAAGDKTAFYDKLFVSYLSGYSLNLPKNVPVDREGKFFLPVVEAVLKRKDLDPGDRALLRRTAEWIRECCFGGDERKQE